MPMSLLSPECQFTKQTFFSGVVTWGTVIYLQNFLSIFQVGFLEQNHTFPSTTETLAAGEDSAVDVAGNMWKLASLGDLTISFWRYNRWWRSLETHASNQSWDFTWSNEQEEKVTGKSISCLPLAQVNHVPHNDPGTLGNRFHLQMVDVLFCVKVYSPCFLFNWHHRQSNIYAPMDFPFLNLKSKD